MLTRILALCSCRSQRIYSKSISRRNHLTTKVQFYCKPEWSAFLFTLSSLSPVCAMIHPSERVSSLILVMLTSDITQDVVNLKVLQEEIPVIFDLVRSLGYYPKEILAPLLNELSRVALHAGGKPEHGSIAWRRSTPA